MVGSVQRQDQNSQSRQSGCPGSTNEQKKTYSSPQDGPGEVFRGLPTSPIIPTQPTHLPATRGCGRSPGATRLRLAPTVHSLRLQPPRSTMAATRPPLRIQAANHSTPSAARRRCRVSRRALARGLRSHYGMRCSRPCSSASLRPRGRSSSAVRRGPCPVAARHAPRCCCGTCHAAARAAHLRFAPSALRPGCGCAYASRIGPRSLRLRRAVRFAHSRAVPGARSCAHCARLRLPPLWAAWAALPPTPCNPTATATATPKTKDKGPGIRS